MVFWLKWVLFLGIALNNNLVFLQKANTAYCTNQYGAMVAGQVNAAVSGAGIVAAQVGVVSSYVFP